MNTNRSLVKAIKFALIAGLSTQGLTVANAATLQSIETTAPSQGQSAIEFNFDGNVGLPRVFEMSSPSRLVLDFKASSTAPRRTNGDGNLVMGIESIASANVTRNIISLAAGSEHRLLPTEDGFKLIISSVPQNLQTFAATSVAAGGTNDAALDSTLSLQHLPMPIEVSALPSSQMLNAPIESVVYENDLISNRVIAAADTAVSYEPSLQAEPLLFTHSIDAVDFRGSDNPGDGELRLKLSSSDATPDVVERAGKIIVTVGDANVAQRLQRRMDVRDFDSPIMYVDTRQAGSNAVITITPRTGLFDWSNVQTNRDFTLRFKPRNVATLAKKTYTGKTLSMNFQDISVRAALQMIADFNERNMVISDTVDGSLTLRLKNVPWDEAMDIVLKTKGLAMRETGTVIYVAPAEELAAMEEAELAAQSNRDDLAPLITTYIPVNYAKAKDISEILYSRTNEDNRNGVLSARGSVSFDERTNTLLITETAERIEEIRDVMRRLDVPVRQVMIEARIVVASDEFERELGMSVGGRAYGDSYANAATSGVVNSGFNLDLGATAKTGTIDLQLAKLPLGRLLDLELSAMQADGRGDVISSPRVITTNQKVATIEQGVEIPYLARDQDSVSVVFRKATLSLEVLPQITPDERIIMDLKLKRDTVGTFYGEGSLQTPSIDTRAVTTQVLVRNGETVVLGGIYEELNIDETDTVPGLAKLPIIGKVFKHQRQVDRKSELLVFVTPKLLSSDL
ncbi:MAG: type IV pilus secretin PilQ [Gammaproteobacteria bacterium]|nr:type IV pilus secretin PilQ [Gammaproteobacteria bacterium]